VLWTTPLFGGIGIGLVCLIRWLVDWQPVWDAQALLTVSLVAFPLGFLVGLGGFEIGRAHV